MTTQLHALRLRKLLSATVAAGLLFFLLLFSFGSNAQEQAEPATQATKAANAQLMNELPFNDKTSFEQAHKGFIAPLPQEPIKGANGNLIWDPAKYAFIKEGQAAPDTVNPSLWRQSQLINISGLFKVTDGIYQVRNFDLSNMTIVEGKTGLTIFDPLVSSETAKAALDLYFKHRPKKRYCQLNGEVVEVR